MDTRLGRHAAKVLAALRQLPWGELGAELVLLHGSVLRSTRPRDIDLVVFLRPGVDVDEAALRIMEAVEAATGLEADVYPVIDEAEADCFLILEAAKGVIVYQTLRGRERLVKAINICNDFMLSRRKLRYTERLVERVLRGAAGEAARNDSQTR